MKKKKIIVGLLCAASIVGLAACTEQNENGNENPPADDDKETKYTITYDVCGHGTAPQIVSDVTAIAASHLVELTDADYDFQGWYLDSSYNTKALAGNITANVTLYAKWTLKVVAEVEYENVTTNCDLAALLETYGEGTKTTQDVTQGKFTFEQGVYFNASSGFMTGNLVNNQQKKIYFTLSGIDSENSIKFDAKGASRGTLKLYNSQNEVVHDFGEIADPQFGLEVTGLEAGTYFLSSVGSLRLGQISVTEKLAKSEPINISVKGGVVKELQGREFSSAGLSVYLNYENGRQDRIPEGYTVDDSEVDMATPGTYNVNVSYTVEGVAEPFTTSYEITIYNIDSLVVSDHSINSSRVTYPVQKIFGKGEAFNSDNLAVTCTCSAPGSDKSETFVLSASEYTISGVENVNETGKKTVTVSVGSKSVTYDIYYIEKDNVDATNVIVDSSLSQVTLKDGVYNVMSVNQAVQVLKALDADQNETKTITVKAGSYKEKVEIDIPNVRLIGAGATPADTVLWCDILAGNVDPSNTSAYSTDGCASVSIRATAEGFYAENITFKNYYNTHELYTLSKTFFSDTQAVACLVQADKSYFKNCVFSSYHDTLYAMDGRQYYENCFIEGRTDYIFGAASTCYFKDCTISTIGANDSKNGGYIVATKGTPGLLYGYIFDGCTLTTSGEVVDGTVSLARGWDNGMTLAFINCDISKAYSVSAYGTKVDEKNERYTNMNAKPNANQLFEYGNTGEGALPESTINSAVNGLIENICVYLTEAQAANFTDFSVIFNKLQIREGSTNFETPYMDNWDGTAGSVITSHTVDFAIFSQNYDKISVSDYFANDMEIVLPEGDSHVIRWNGNSVQFDIGTKITFKTKGKIYVDWYGGSYGNAANGIITYKDGYATLEIINCPGCSGVYIKSIRVDLTDVCADSEYFDVTFDLGYEGSTAIVENIPENNQVAQPADPTRDGYDFVGWFIGEEEFDFNTKLTEATTITAVWNEVTDLTFVTDTTVSFSGTNAYTGQVLSGETKKVNKLLVAGNTNGSFVKHDSSWYKLLGDATISISVKKGATITFTTYDGCLTVGGVAVEASWYTGATGSLTYKYTAQADETVVFGKADGANQAYISSIVVETTDVLLSSIDTDQSYKYNGTVESTEYFALHNVATNGDWLKFLTNGRITFFVKAGATITIGGSPYDDAEAYLAIGTEELTNVGGVWTYTATSDGRIDLINSGTVYIKTIKVTYPAPDTDDTNVISSLNLNVQTDAASYADGDAITSIGLIAFTGCVKHGGKYIALKENNSVKLTLAGGSTLSVYMPYSNGVMINGVAYQLVNDYLTYTVPTGEAKEITITGAAGNAYIQAIKVVTPLTEYEFNWADVSAKYEASEAVSSTAQVEFTGCVKHDNQYIALKENNSIKLTLAGGTKLVVNMPYSSGVKINGVDVTLDANNNLVYIVPAGAPVEVIITGTAGNAYITSISVTPVTAE